MIHENTKYTRILSSYIRNTHVSVRYVEMYLSIGSSIMTLSPKYIIYKHTTNRTVRKNCTSVVTEKYS